MGPAPFPGASTRLIDLLFSHFTGAFFTSTAVFVVYAAARRGRPELFAETALPSFAGGCIWAVAMVASFIANADLSLVIAFVSGGASAYASVYRRPLCIAPPPLTSLAANDYNGPRSRESGIRCRALRRDPWSAEPGAASHRTRGLPCRLRLHGCVVSVV